VSKKKDPKDLLKVGRKTKYKPEYCQMLMAHMKQGLSYQSFGGVDGVGVSIETLYTWEEKFPEFLDAKKTGQASCLLWWERVGNSMAIGKLKGCLGTYVFNMKNRFGWKDVKERPNDFGKDLEKEDTYQVEFE